MQIESGETMITISLCMIVKNEESVLARCLDSVQGVFDETVIVDTGSTDQTKEIAAGFGAKVYEFQWIDDFAAARNASFAKASMDYCMWLDADDVIEESQKKKLIQLKTVLSADVDVVMMKYHTAFDPYGTPVFSYYRERLIRNTGRALWAGAVHEAIPPWGSILYSDIAVCHRKLGPGDPDRNLRIYEKLLGDHVPLDPRQQYYYGRELYYHHRYEDALSVFREFLDSPDGWVENKIEACSLCAVCWETLQNSSMALQALLHSLTYDLPRAELCCEIGRHFFRQEDYKTAAFWYELAQSREKQEQGGGFILPDCYDYIPFLQLCVCYHKMGNWQKAKEYNEKAGRCKPNSEAFLLNQKYFETVEKEAPPAGSTN